MCQQFCADVCRVTSENHNQEDQQHIGSHGNVFLTGREL